jgi:fused signal recognition particle receptor
MFDGLKKKLNRFREDVEETAEEKAEAEAEAAAEEPADAAEPAGADAEPAEADAEPAEADAEPAEADAEPAEADAEPAGADAEPADEADEAAESADADVSAESEAEAPPAGASDGDGTVEADADGTAGADAAESAAERERRAAANVEQALSADEDGGQSGPGRLKRAAAFATGKIIIEEEDLEDPLWDLEMALLESDVEMGVAEEILDTIREKMIGETRAQVQSTGELVSEALHDALYDVISVGQFDFDERVAAAEKPVTIIFTGVNGVGKTTTIAKLSEYFEQRGYSTVLANGDTYRAGANEQIREHAANLDRKLISHEQGGDPAAVLYDAVEYAKANDVDVVLGDTAGRLHTSSDLMAQLEKIHRVVDPDMTLFVDEAVAGQDAVQRARQFDEAATIDGTVLTKADADSQGGAAISIAYVTGKPILFLGTGQGYDDIERFDPERLVDRLLGEE